MANGCHFEPLKSGGIDLLNGLLSARSDLEVIHLGDILCVLRIAFVNQKNK